MDNRGKIKIDSNTKKINELDDEVAHYRNEKLILSVFKQTEDLEHFSGADEKLGKLNNLKGKISQK